MKIFKIKLTSRSTHLLLSAAVCMVGLPLWEALVWVLWASSELSTGLAIGLAITIGLALVGGSVGFLVWVFWEPEDHFLIPGGFRLKRHPPYWQAGGQASHYPSPRPNAPDSDWAMWSLIYLSYGTDFWFGGRRWALTCHFEDDEIVKIRRGLEILVNHGLVELRSEWRSDPNEWIYLPTPTFFKELPDYRERYEDRTV